MRPDEQGVVARRKPAENSNGIGLDLPFLERAMDANTIALNLIQKWVGPDDKVTDMSAFYDAS